MNTHIEENPCKWLKTSPVLEEHVLEWNDIVWETLLMLPMEFSKISNSFKSQRRPDIAPVSAESGWAFLLWYLIELFCFKRQSLRAVSLSRGWMLTHTGFHCSEGATHLLPHGNLKWKLQDTSCTLKIWLFTLPNMHRNAFIKSQTHNWNYADQLIYDLEQQSGVWAHRIQTAESYERTGGISTVSVDSLNQRLHSVDVMEAACRMVPADVLK